MSSFYWEGRNYKETVTNNHKEITETFGTHNEKRRIWHSENTPKAGGVRESSG